VQRTPPRPTSPHTALLGEIAALEDELLMSPAECDLPGAVTDLATRHLGCSQATLYSVAWVADTPLLEPMPSRLRGSTFPRHCRHLPSEVVAVWRPDAEKPPSWALLSDRRTLLLPVLVRRELVATVWLQRLDAWSDDDLLALRLLTSVVGFALEARRAQDAVINARAEVRRIRRLADAYHAHLSGPTRATVRAARGFSLLFREERGDSARGSDETLDALADQLHQLATQLDALVALGASEEVAHAQRAFAAEEAFREAELRTRAEHPELQLSLSMADLPSMVGNDELLRRAAAALFQAMQCRATKGRATVAVRGEEGRESLRIVWSDDTPAPASGDQRALAELILLRAERYAARMGGSLQITGDDDQGLVVTLQLPYGA
jgi:hypothetical protein